MSHNYPSIVIGDVRRGDRIRTETVNGTYLPDQTGLKVFATEWIAEKDYTDGMAMEDTNFYLIERPKFIRLPESEYEAFRKWWLVTELNPDADEQISIFLQTMRDHRE